MKLKAQKRSLVGKKVRNLRNEGIVPATIYGPLIDSYSIQFDEKEFKKVFDKVGFNKFIELEVDDAKPVKTLVKDINIHPLKDYVQDVSLYQVDEDRKVSVEVPIEVTGEAPAVKQKLGFLVQQTYSVKVYCLPKDLPDDFVIDISSIETTSDSISLTDLVLPADVEFDSSVDPSASIVYMATDQKEIVEDTVEEEGEEGEEGEGNAEEEKSEEASE